MFRFKTFLTVGLILSVTACGCSSESGSTAPSGGSNVVRNPEKELMYSSVASSQEEYIRSLRTSTGALSYDPGGTRLCPYFSNYAAIGLLTRPGVQNEKLVKEYMDWYIGKLNGNVNPKTGAAEIPGSIYDYQISNGAEITSGKYDSVDSYAATFLILAEKLMKISAENEAWLKERSNKINLIASAMIACIDSPSVKVPEDYSPDDNDYLSVASFVYPAKYLMDNCEVNRGLLAAKRLQDNGVITDSVDYQFYLEKNAEGIESQLWNNSTYRWIDQPGSNSNWNNFYADAVAQLTPVMMGVLKSEDARSKSLWDEFNGHYGNWSSGYNYSEFPWVFICFGAASMGDADRVEEYVKHIYSYTSKNTQKKNWYSSEAGELLIAIDLIKNKTIF
ncbi:MAG: hypothetical protein ACI3ZF_02410 [Candidatus Cryptobacteroides sp.]